MLLLFHCSFLLLACFRGVFARRTCGSSVVPQANLDNAATLLQEVIADVSLEGIFASRRLTIDVYFHVLRQGLSIADGNIPKSALKAQMKVLNADLRRSGVSWRLVSTSYTTHEDWFLRAEEVEVEREFKSALRRGNYRAMNVYFCEMDLLGFATFPVAKVNRTQEVLTMDGVVINHRTVPGGNFTGFDLGRTLTHEAGHWLDLYHTFTDGCSAENDFVRDTPAEAEPAFGCPTGRDTCTGREFEGEDPIHNFMDYSDDSCMNELTPGQTVRLHQSWAKYRMY